MHWKRLLKMSHNEVMGLDIGSSAVKIVQMRKDDSDWAVTAAGIVNIADGTEGNKNRREINTAKAICDCLWSAGIQTKLAVCSVCGTEVAVRHFRFPSLPPGEVEGAIMLEAAQVCPFNVEDGVVDYQIIPDDENSIRGFLVAVTNKLIKGKSQFAKNASLNTVLMDVDGLALLNCFNEYEKPEPGRTTAVLNVGSSFANLAIVSDNALPFIRDIAYAGRYTIEQISDENAVSTEAVSRILFDSSAGNHQEPELELGDSLAKACQKLIVDITETLRYYTAQKKSAIIKKVFVCGGFAPAKGFIDMLDSHLPAKAVLWNPFEKIRCDAGKSCEDILQKNGPAMAVAAGLAMRSI